MIWTLLSIKIHLRRWFPPKVIFHWNLKTILLFRAWKWQKRMDLMMKMMKHMPSIKSYERNDKHSRQEIYGRFAKVRKQVILSNLLIFARISYLMIHNCIMFYHLFPTTFTVIQIKPALPEMAATNHIAWLLILSTLMKIFWEIRNKKRWLSTLVWNYHLL